MDQVMDTILVAGAVATALGAMLMFAVRAYRGVRDFMVSANAASKLINAELTRNGGGSLLDKVNKIEPYHIEAKRRLDAIEEGHKAIVRRLDKIEAATSTPREFP